MQIYLLCHASLQESSSLSSATVDTQQRLLCINSQKGFGKKLVNKGFLLSAIYSWPHYITTVSNQNLSKPLEVLTVHVFIPLLQEVLLFKIITTYMNIDSLLQHW